jgi:hypothetical protein
MPALIVIAPEEIARARHLYECTSVPVHDIARMLGIGTTTFMKRVKEWGWVKRNRRLAELDAAGAANVPLNEIHEMAEAPMAVLQRTALIERVRAAVEREIVAIEQVLASVEGVRLRSQDAHRAARTLATLVRTLREVSRLEETAGDKPGEEREDQFRDLDEFRRELSARLDRLRQAGDSG